MNPRSTFTTSDCPRCHGAAFTIRQKNKYRIVCTICGYIHHYTLNQEPEPPLGEKKMKTKTLRKTPDIFPLDHIRVVDGDTLLAVIRLPFDVLHEARIRIRDFWADELDGPYATQGLQAQLRLKNFLEGKAVWLHAPSCRKDKFGRVLGHLMHHDRIITGREVLGELQLTEKEHKARKDQLTAMRQNLQKTAEKYPHITSVKEWENSLEGPSSAKEGHPSAEYRDEEPGGQWS
jgi:hypothetical protein